MQNPEELAGFLDALRAEGVDAAALERVQAAYAHTVIAVGTTLLSSGEATQLQLDGAQRRWAAAPAPAPAAPTVQRLGHYTIEKKLGAGGMGEVYLVRDPTTGATFAAKRLLGLGSPEERLRFKREARVLAALSHPNLAAIHAAELEGPTPYFLLDYYPGGTLGERLEQGPLDDATARALLTKLTAALTAAHEQGVLHRDLKPDNVMFDEAGEPRLVDFGLGLSLNSHSNRLTQTGMVLGTPSYMPPEQVEDAKRVDARSDVYSLGGILYACLTGRPPVAPQPSVFATLREVLKGTIVPPSKVREVDPDLEAICLRALAKDPAARFQTSAALGEALRTAPAARRKPVAALFAAAAALLGSLALTGVLLNSGGETDAEIDRAAALEAERAERVADWRGAVELPAYDRDLLERAQRVLDQIPREALQAGRGVSPAQAKDWQQAWDLNRLADALLPTGSARNDLDEALELLALMRGVNASALQEPLVVGLLLQGLDAWIVCFNRLEGRSQRAMAEAFGEFAVSFRPHDMLDFAVRLVEATHDLSQPTHQGAQLGAVCTVENMNRWLLGCSQEKLLALPPHLRLEALDGTSAVTSRIQFPKLEQRIYQWVASARSAPPLGSERVLAGCARLVTQLLQFADPRAEPNVELARAVLSLAKQLPKQSSTEELAPRLEQLQAEVALCAGDLTAVDAYLETADPGESTAFLRAATLLVKARALAPEERGQHLDDASKFLDDIEGKTRVKFAAMAHVDFLRGRNPRIEVLEAWSTAEDALHQQPVALPWYLHYLPKTRRFPCFSIKNDTRHLVWVPGTLYEAR